jgi:hypothetical protein
VGEEAWRLRKAKSLVKLLCLAPGHALQREQLMDLLWPELGKTAATNNLRVSLHAARRALSPDPVAASRYLASKEERIALCSEGQLWVDIEAFKEAANAARRSREPAAYRAALELYGGELLPEDRYPLLRYVTLVSGPDLERRGRLYITIPVCSLAPAREHDALPGGRIVADHLEHRLPKQTALAPPVDEQKEPMSQQPTQVEAVEEDGQAERQ